MPKQAGMSNSIKCTRLCQIVAVGPCDSVVMSLALWAGRGVWRGAPLLIQPCSSQALLPPPPGFYRLQNSLETLGRSGLLFFFFLLHIHTHKMFHIPPPLCQWGRGQWTDMDTDTDGALCWARGRWCGVWGGGTRGRHSTDLPSCAGTNTAGPDQSAAPAAAAAGCQGATSFEEMWETVAHHPDPTLLFKVSRCVPCSLEGLLSLQLGAREVLSDEKGWQLTSWVEPNHVCTQYHLVLPTVPHGYVVVSGIGHRNHSDFLWPYSFCKKTTHSVVVSTLTWCLKDIVLSPFERKQWSSPDQWQKTNRERG